MSQVKKRKERVFLIKERNIWYLKKRKKRESLAKERKRGVVNQGEKERVSQVKNKMRRVFLGKERKSGCL